MGPEGALMLAAYLRTYGLPHQAELVEQMAADRDRWRRYALHLKERLAGAGQANQRLALTLHQVRQAEHDAATQWTDVYCVALRERDEARAEVARLEQELAAAKQPATSWYELSGTWEGDCKAAEARIAELDTMLARLQSTNQELNATNHELLDRIHGWVGLEKQVEVVALARDLAQARAAQLVAERDRARVTAVRLEGEVARLSQELAEMQSRQGCPVVRSERPDLMIGEKDWWDDD